MNIIGQTSSDTLKKLKFSNMSLEQAYPETSPLASQEMPQYGGEDPGGYTPQGRILYWYHPDYIQNVDLITDIDGAAYELFLYNPWGEQLHHWTSSSSSWTSPYRFNAKELDPETGLSYYGARYYQSKLGVWLSVDPMADMAPEWTPYRTFYNNPIYYMDPIGLLESTHIDENGNVVAEYDDGDDGVYVHDNGTTRTDIDNQRATNGNTGGTGTHIGELGGTINVDRIYENTLKANTAEAKNIYSPFKFKDYVKTNGKWDLKNNKKTIYGLGNDGKTKFKYKGRLMESQDIGNHHFGAVGKAYGFFSEIFMLKQAGAYQIKSGTSKPEWQQYKTTYEYQFTKTGRMVKVPRTEMLPPYGDDPRDQGFIREGYRWYNNR